MLLFGGGTLVGGLVTLHDPNAMTRNWIRNVSRAPAAEEAVRKLEPALDAIATRHRAAARVDAIVSIAFGLFTLYAVAAVMSRDRNGRLLALLTATFGIIYQLAELPLRMQIAKEAFAVGGSVLAETLGAAGEAGAHSQTELVGAVNAAAVLLAALGVGWCLLLLRYFGGRRGRELYGLPRRT
jgi:hypothetical protein